jgi:mRNA interferase MazF
MNRGDVVIVDFPYSDLTGSKVRPALVVQSDLLNRARSDTILAIITSTYGGRVTELRIDIATEGGSGLKFNSAVPCDTLVTIDQSLVLRTIGSLSATAMTQVDNCLKAALGLP